MDRLQIQSKFIDGVKSQARPAVAQSGLGRGLGAALTKLANVLSFGRLQKVTAVRAGSHGGTDVEGTR
jgi:hypothetical protein